MTRIFRKSPFLRQSLLLTLGNLAAKGVTMLISSLLALKLGGVGLGELSLANGIYFLCLSLGGGGLCTAVSIMTSTERGRARRVLRGAFLLSLGFSLTIAILLFALAGWVSIFILKNGDVAGAVRIAALCLPFVAASGCIKGYFYGVGKTFPVSSAQFFEQVVRLGATWALFLRFPRGGLENVFGGVLVGEVFSLVYLYAFVPNGRERREERGERRAVAQRAVEGAVVGKRRGLRIESEGCEIIKQLLGICLPLSVVPAITSALRWAEDLLLLSGLTRFFGGSATPALSFIGRLTGTVMPLIFLPAPIFFGAITLLTPKAAGLHAAGDGAALARLTRKACSLCILGGVVFAGVLFLFAGEISGVFYGREAGGAGLLRLLAFICPFMYFESAAASILTGIGEQNFIMRLSVLDCILRILLVVALVPTFGSRGFLVAMGVSNILTPIATFWKLKKVTRAG